MLGPNIVLRQDRAVSHHAKSTVIPMLITISSEKSGKDNVATRHTTTVYPMTKPRRRNGST